MSQINKIYKQINKSKNCQLKNVETIKIKINKIKGGSVFAL